MIQNNNSIALCGTVATLPQLSHEVYGEKFYTFSLKVTRLSGQSDLLPVVVSERLIGETEISIGKSLMVEGQLRSYNIITDGKSRLQLQAFALCLKEAEAGSDMNTITLDGFICKPPLYRVTPFEREITDILLAVNRAYGKSDYIPLICWGRNARFCKSLSVGSPLRIEGRLQSREYQKKLDDAETETRTAYEVSVSKLSVKKENDFAFAEAEK